MIMAGQLSLNSKIHINPDVLFQELQGEAVLLNEKTGVYLRLNPVGTRVWELLEQNQPLSGILSALLKDYEVTEERLTQDLFNLIHEMVDNDLIEVDGR
jgi:hypothetical protein